MGSASPLAVKSDNESALIARNPGDVFAVWGILHLRNPGANLQYTGSCEAASASQKMTTEG